MPVLLMLTFFRRACGLLAALSLGAVACAETPSDEMARGFVSPPGSARPWVWGHWLHGNVNQECITRELEAIKRVGLGGVTMFDVAQDGIPPGPNKYMDANWRHLFAWEVSEAKRLGLEVMSHVGPGYSGTGGPWIRPEFASQRLFESSIRVKGQQRFSGKLPQAATPGGFYQDVAVLAIRETPAQGSANIPDLDMKRLVWLNYIRWKGVCSAPTDATVSADRCIAPHDVIDLTKRMKPDGMLDWQVPEGEWTLLRFGHGWTGQKTLPAPPEGTGPECDKLAKHGIRAHFDHVMKQMIDLAGPEVGKTFHTFFMDSWEAGGQNWTEEMPAEFKRRRGYDIIPFLPVMTGRVVGDLRTSERFLFDLRKTVSELAAENFWSELARLCHERGMRLAAQPYITTGQDLDAANFIDEPMGEFWSHPFQPNNYIATVKLASSAANLNGRLIVGAEAFTADEKERWLAHPATLKALGDEAFCLGANRFQIHRFAMQRFPQLSPGMTMGKWGQHYDSTQTWWEWTNPWHDYLARCQYLLRQGPVVSDMLALADEEPLHRFDYRPVAGYGSDVCGPEAFLKIEMIGSSPGVRGGPVYQLITVDHRGTMSVGRLKKLRELVKQGASLLGEPPVSTPGFENLPAADSELKSIAAELWGNSGETERRVGAGRVFRGISAEEVLRRVDVPPDFSGPPEIRWIHRRNADTDLYFISSTSTKPVGADIAFRVTGKSAEMWDPLSGKIRLLPDAVSNASGITRVHMDLEPQGSAFVVFRPGPSKADARPLPHAGPPVMDVNGPWTLSFPAYSAIPDAMKLARLTSWSRLDNPEARYFSGTARYQTNFTLAKAPDRAILDLGRVEIMARVRLNGRDLGILWRPPYQADVSGLLRAGPNELEVEVVNQWVNRLIGDAFRPEDPSVVRNSVGYLLRWPEWVLERKTDPAGRRSFVTYPLWKANDKLVDSGLLGPVRVLSIR